MSARFLLLLLLLLLLFSTLDSPKSAVISHRHNETNTQDFRSDYFNLFLVILPKFGSFQFHPTIIRYKPLWHPAAWVSCGQTRGFMSTLTARHTVKTTSISCDHVLGLIRKDQQFGCCFRLIHWAKSQFFSHRMCTACKCQCRDKKTTELSDPRPRFRFALHTQYIS